MQNHSIMEKTLSDETTDEDWVEEGSSNVNSTYEGSVVKMSVNKYI